MNRRVFLSTCTATAAAFSHALAADRPKLRVAVIGHTGLGDYGHGLEKVWPLLPETELVAVADANPAGLVSARERLGKIAAFGDFREMLAETKPEIVAIGPRHVGEHRDMLMTAIESGAKGIYIEKPFCRTLLEADEVIAASDRKGVKIAVAHRNRYHPVLTTLTKLIADGKLGRVLELRARGKEDARGGAQDLWVLGSHLLNLAPVFTGPITACSAQLLQEGRPVERADLRQGDEGVGLIGGNEMHARFDSKSGVPVFFDSVAKAGVPAAGFGLQIIGTLGLIDLRLDREPLAHLLEGNPFQPSTEPLRWKPVTTAGPDQAEPIANLGSDLSKHVVPVRDLISAIAENRQPLCSAADARAVLECTMAVFASHRASGARVTLPLSERTHPLDGM